MLLDWDKSGNRLLDKNERLTTTDYLSKDELNENKNNQRDIRYLKGK